MKKIKFRFTKIHNQSAIGESFFSASVKQRSLGDEWKSGTGSWTSALGATSWIPNRRSYLHFVMYFRALLNGGLLILLLFAPHTFEGEL